MALPLPGAFVDTGFVGSYQATANFRLKQLQAGGAQAIFFQVNDDPGLPSWVFALANWTGSPCLIPPTTPGTHFEWDVRASGTGITTTVLEHYATPGCELTTNVHPSGTYGITYTAGPFRLGMSYGLAGASQSPNFANDYKTEFAWFADENTQINVTFCGLAATTRYWLNGLPAPPAPGVAAMGGMPTFTFGKSIDLGLYIAEISGIAVQGQAVDVTELNDGFLNGSSGVVLGRGPGTHSAGAGCPFIFSYNLAVTKFGGADINARVLDSYVVPAQLHADGSQKTPQQDYLTTPHSESYVAQVTTWATHKKTFAGTMLFSIQPAWAAAQDPALPSNDLELPMPTRAPRLYSAGEYHPVSLTIAPEVSIQRPDGNRPSDWVGSGDIAVTEGATDTTFVVTGIGASALRTLTTDWKRRVGAPPYGTGDPLFGIENYERTKHQSGEDVWGWEQYGYGELRITSPRSETLFLRVRGNYLSVYDPHVTGGNRVADYVATLVPFVATYQLNLSEGENTLLIDWLFPSSATIDGAAVSNPFYYGRVDDLQLSGFRTGAFVLSVLKLKSRGDAYFKAAWGKQIVRDDYSLPVLALNGAFNFGNVPDQVYKPDEIGGYGGSLRYIQPLTGDPSGIVQDSQYSLQDFWTKMNNLEGLTATYSQAAHDAAMIDLQGKELTAAEPAHCLLPVVPYALVTPGSAYTPDCSVVGGTVEICPGLAFAFVVNHPLWGGLEALVISTEGERVSDGIKINAVRADTGAIVASGFTDRFGYVVVTPIPANGVREYALQGAE